MYTYTTPEITCTFTDVDFTSVDYVRIAVGDCKKCVIRELDITDINTTAGTAVIELTQEETAQLGTGLIAIQARIHYTDGTVLGTNKVYKRLHDMLDKVVI